MALGKTDLVKAIAELNDVTKSEVRIVLDATLDTITEALAEGESVTLQGFGTFSTTVRKARIGRNPSTGEEMQIPEINSVKFKAARKFKDIVNE